MIEGPIRQKVLELIERKDEIEKNINSFGEILRSNKNVGMQEPLVDESGFPRNDIDVYLVRHARHEIICLKNDLKELMKQIEKGLEVYHADIANNMDTDEMESTTITVQHESTELMMTPFVKVDFVNPGSPAATAGILVDDKIVQFGSIKATNFNNIMQIGEIVNHRKDQIIEVKVLRNNKIMNIRLIPRSWSGRGLLGCNVILCR